MNSILKNRVESSLLLIPVLVFIVLRIFEYDGLYGQDSYEYLRYTERIKAFIFTGIHPGEFVWPKGYPIVAGILSLVIPAHISTQFVSFVSLYGLLIFTRRIIKELTFKESCVLPFLIIALLLSPYMLRASVMAMSDLLAAFWLTGCVYFGIRYGDKHTFGAFFWCLLFGSLSVFTRYVAAIPIALIFLAVGYVEIKNKKWLHSLASFVPVMFLYLHYYLETEEFNPFHHNSIVTWDIKNFFKSSFVGEIGIFNYILPNLLYAFSSVYSPGFLLINGLLFLFLFKKRKLLLKVDYVSIAIIVISYSFFLAGIPYQNNRFLLLTYPLVLILLFPAFTDLMDRFQKKRNYILAALVVMQLVLFVRAIEPTFRLSMVEKEITTQMYAYQNQTLYSFEIDIALEGRGLDFEYRNLWKEEYKSFDEGALVLFNEEKFRTQWEGKNPMINWNQIKNKHQLTLIKELDANWKLYRIEN